MIRAAKILGYILRNDPAITDVVSANDIFFGEIPQGNTSDTKIRFFITETMYATTKDAQSTVDSYWVQVDVYAKDIINASTVGSELRRVVDQYPPGEINGEYLDGISIEEEVLDADILFDRDVSRYSIEFKVRVKNDIVANYITDEVNTGATWIDGSTIYKRTYAGSGILFTDSDWQRTVIKYELLFKLSGSMHPLVHEPFGIFTPNTYVLGADFGGDSFWSAQAYSAEAWVTLYYIKSRIW